MNYNTNSNSSSRNKSEHKVIPHSLTSLSEIEDKYERYMKHRLQHKKTNFGSKSTPSTEHGTGDETSSNTFSTREKKLSGEEKERVLNGLQDRLHMIDQHLNALSQSLGQKDPDEDTWKNAEETILKRQHTNSSDIKNTPISHSFSEIEEKKSKNKHKTKRSLQQKQPPPINVPQSSRSNYSPFQFLTNDSDHVDASSFSSQDSGVPGYDRMVVGDMDEERNTKEVHPALQENHNIDGYSPKRPSNTFSPMTPPSAYFTDVSSISFTNAESSISSNGSLGDSASESFSSDSKQSGRRRIQTNNSRRSRSKSPKPSNSRNAGKQQNTRQTSRSYRRKETNPETSTPSRNSSRTKNSRRERISNSYVRDDVSEDSSNKSIARLRISSPSTNTSRIDSSLSNNRTSSKSSATLESIRESIKKRRADARRREAARKRSKSPAPVKRRERSKSNPRRKPVQEDEPSPRSKDLTNISNKHPNIDDVFQTLHTGLRSMSKIQSPSEYSFESDSSYRSALSSGLSRRTPRRSRSPSSSNPEYMRQRELRKQQRPSSLPPERDRSPSRPNHSPSKSTHSSLISDSSRFSTVTIEDLEENYDERSALQLNKSWNSLRSSGYAEQWNRRDTLMRLRRLRRRSRSATPPPKRKDVVAPIPYSDTNHLHRSPTQGSYTNTTYNWINNLCADKYVRKDRNPSSLKKASVKVL
eukprot:gb/GECH01003710.1/.p1 GENE.gb/GECH01003710.1/~~gb/GECH01003710.1/.p1  ORF type:complete len:698 (+),score=121.85 gb/GECH01003710.1/:1-2094(+)